LFEAWRGSAVMARGKRRASIVPTTDVAALEEISGAASNGTDEDDVDEFVRQRHSKMQRASRGTRSDEEDDDQAVEDFETLKERGVMDIDVEDDDEHVAENERGIPANRKRRTVKLAAGSLEAENGKYSESSEEERQETDLDGGWGGRRRMWYGGDTQDYEIMGEEEREEALQDEEEEALRLQSKLLGSMRPEDFLDSDHEEAGDNETVGEGGGVSHEAEDVSDVTELSVDLAPEVSVLALELIASLRLMRELKSSIPVSRSALLRFHVMASFATNVAFYLSLRTDPDASKVDLKAHPVIGSIVRIREVRKACDPIDWKVYDHAGSSSSGAIQEMAINKASALDLERIADLSGSKSEPGQVVTNAGTEKKRRKRKRAQSTGLDSAVDDMAFESTIVDSSVPVGMTYKDRHDEDAARRRKFSRMVGVLERERQNRALLRATPGDMDVARDVTSGQQLSNPSSSDARDNLMNPPDDEGDEALMERILEKRNRKEARLARKRETEQPHVYRFDDGIKDKTMRRRASQQIVLNRGLTRYRPRDRKTPRTKNREAFGKAVKKRRSVVRDPVVEKPVSYGGEASGINMRARKGSRLSEV
jgi:hypothetical protein